MVPKDTGRWYILAERISKYILDWEHERGDTIVEINEKIKKTGDSVFSQEEKIVLSEMIGEYGQQRPKILIAVSEIEREAGEFTVKERDFPSFYRFLKTHRFSPELDIEYGNIKVHKNKKE